MTDFFKKHTLITGTLLLTATGFATRLLGFFYRIFLSRAIGAEGLGLYNMVHPIYGICFGICAGSIQTAISRCTAAQVRRGKAFFRTGLAISLNLGIILAWAVTRFAGPLSRNILMEEQCAALLPFMAVSIPFSAVHACINGWYYGIKRTKVPAFSQIVEQSVRMTAVFFIADILTKNGQPITVELAAAGHLIGEAASCLYSVFCFTFFSASPADGRITSGSAFPAGGRTASGFASPAGGRTASENIFSNFRRTAAPLMALALPLMGNRLILNLLTSAESIWIPGKLTAYGLSSSEAISICGVLNGMAMPFILFPSAITNSMAVLLLPAVAEAQANNQRDLIARTIAMSLRYSLYMGILCIGVFTLFGDVLGTSVFHNADAGRFMEILAWLCPFLYLSTTTGSILNGLGRSHTVFLQNTAALLIRLGFILFGIPRFGILACLWGMLAAELFLSGSHLWSLRRIVFFPWDIWEMAVKPALFLVLSIGILRFCELPVSAAREALRTAVPLPDFFWIALRAAILSLCYGGLLLLSHLTKKAAPYSQDDI